MKVIFPPASYQYRGKTDDGPLFFFGGPIPGGGNWHFSAYELLIEKMKKRPFAVASPARFELAQEVRSNIEAFPDQLSWEIKRACPHANVVMGGEKGFPGLPEIERYNDIVLGEGVLPIYLDLGRVIDQAIQLVDA